MCDPSLDNFFFFSPTLLYTHTIPSNVILFLGSTDRGSLSLSGPSISLSSLTSDRQSSSMSNPSICSGINETLDTHRYISAQISFDIAFTIDNFTKLDNFFFTKILDPDRSINTRFLQDTARRTRTDSCLLYTSPSPRDS